MVEETDKPTKKRVSKKKALVRKKTTAKKTSARKAPVRKKTPISKKKVVRKKKSVATEETFDVTTTKDNAGFTDKETKSITATDTADAIDKLTKQNPEGYDEISIKKKGSGASKKPNTAPVSAEPVNAVPKTTVESESKKETKPVVKKAKRKPGVKLDINTFELTEGFDKDKFNFPYSIVLPMGYEEFISSATERSDEPIMIEENRGRLKTTLESPKAMEDFVKALVDMVDAGTHKDKAEMLITGIMRSITPRR